MENDVPHPPQIDDVPKPPHEPDPVVPKPYGFKDTHTKVENHPRGLRTFESDMAEAVRIQEGSVIKIALAEQEKRANQEVFEKSAIRTNKLFAAGSILLGIAGIAVFGYAFISSKPKTVIVSENPLNQSIIVNDKSIALDITDKSKQQIGQAFYEIAKAPEVREKGVLNIIPVTKELEVALVKSKDFLDAIGSTMPGALYRSLHDEYMLGSVMVDGTGSPFMILRPESFDYAYSGMLNWEKKMVDDLFIMFDIPITGENAYLLSKQFQDTIVRNQDARALIDNNGTIILEYLFVNNDDLIVIAKNETAMFEILDRLGTFAR